MEESAERQDLIAENTEKAKEKLVDMMNIVLDIVGYNRDKKDCINVENRRRFSSAFVSGSAIDQEYLSFLQEVHDLQKKIDDYTVLFGVLVSIYAKMKNTEQIINLNELIKKKIENYDSTGISTDNSDKESVMDVFDELIDVINKNMKFYSYTKQKIIMPIFINGENGNYAHQNLRPLFLTGTSPFVEKLKTDYSVDNLDYNENIIKDVETYNNINERINLSIINPYNDLIHSIMQGKEKIENLDEIKFDSLDLSKVCDLIAETEKIIKENDEKVSKEVYNKILLINKKALILRDCFVLERDLRPKLNDKNVPMKYLNALIEDQINYIGINLQELEGVNYALTLEIRQTLFLIDTKKRDFANEFIGKFIALGNYFRNKLINDTKFWNCVINNIDKFENLLWGIENLSEIFYNDNLSWGKKYEIFALIIENEDKKKLFKNIAPFVCENDLKSELSVESIFAGNYNELVENKQLKIIIEDQISELKLNLQKADVSAEDETYYHFKLKQILFLIDTKCAPNLVKKFIENVKTIDERFKNKLFSNIEFFECVISNINEFGIWVWGIENHPKVFCNKNLSWKAKYKILMVIRRNPEIKESVSDISDLRKIAENENIDSDQLELAALMYYRANILNRRNVVRSMGPFFLKPSSDLVKKFGMNNEEKKKIIDYVYKNRNYFLYGTEQLNKRFETLEEDCQNKLAIFKPEQKEIINSRPENERTKFIEAMQNPIFREVCIDEITAENISCYLDTDFVELVEAWYAQMILPFFEIDNFISKNELNNENGLNESQKKMFARQLMMEFLNYMHYNIVAICEDIELKNTKELINQRVNLSKVLREGQEELEKKILEKGIKLDNGRLLSGDAVAAVGFAIKEVFNNDIRRYAGTEGDMISQVWCLFYLSYKLIIDKAKLTFNFFKNPEKTLLKEVNRYVDLKLLSSSVTCLYPNIAAEIFVKLPNDIAYDSSRKFLENSFKENKEQSNIFEGKFKECRINIIKEAFNEGTKDYNEFLEFLRQERFSYSLIRHVNSPENTKTIYKLLKAGLKDPSKVTTRDLEYTRELINDNLLNISEVVNYFNAGGTNLVEVPKDQVIEFFDFLNSPELNSFEFIDRLKITKVLFNKIDEIKKDPKVVKKFIDEVQDDKLSFAVNNLTNCMVENIKFICSNSSKYGKDSGNRQYSLKNVNLTDALIDICNNFYLGLFTEQSSQMLPVYIDTGELDKNIFNEVFNKHFAYISEDISTREAAGSKLKEFYDNNLDIPEADRVKYTQAIMSLATPKAVFSSISHDYDIICNLHEIENFREELSNLSGGNNLAFYINQNIKSPEAKQITKKLLEIDVISDEKAKEIKSYVLKNIPQDLVNTCKDEIAIEKSGEAIKEMAQAIVDNKAKIDAPNKILAKVIADAIIQNHSNKAVVVAQSLDESNLIRKALMENSEVARLVDKQQHPLDMVQYNKNNSQHVPEGR